MQNANCKLQIENCRCAASICFSDSPLPAGYPLGGSPLSRRGVTLVELLITILIISILAGLILGVASVAGETAREAHTRHMVERLHTLLVEHWDTYKTRRVRLRERQGSVPGVEERINSDIPSTSPNSGARRGATLAEARLYALREMMLMEMPDRWSDILLAEVGQVAQPPLYLIGRTDLSNVYLRRYQSLLSRVNKLTGVPNTADEIKRNQGAECLYMIITIATGDGEARSQFGENSIGDVDGDGAPEFLDGWGHPINFLRWAPGFDSQIQINANQLDNPASGTPGEAWAAAASDDHDPFDVFRVHRNAYRIIPLIYSPGRDEDSGVHTNVNQVTWKQPNTTNITANGNGPPFVAPQLNPYLKNPDYMGTDNGEGTATDNIHNHLLGLR